MKSLTPIRTARLIASLIAFLGMFIFAVERALTRVCLMANDAVQMGLGRYTNSFTGRFAAENFSDDKKLLAVLQQAKELLPIADKYLLILFVVSIVLFIIAAFGIAFPKQFCHVLVALKLLKWQDGVAAVQVTADDSSCECARSSNVECAGECPLNKLREACGKASTVLKKVQLKYWAFAAGAFVFVLILVFGVRGCSNGGIFGNTQNVSDELKDRTLFYISAQKSYFAKTQSVGGPKALQMPDSLSTDNFTYRVTGSRFAATLNKKVKDCPAGSRWTVSSSTKGFFSLDLVLYRQAPKDTNCVFIAPDFKNIGRK